MTDWHEFYKYLYMYKFLFGSDDPTSQNVMHMTMSQWKMGGWGMSFCEKADDFDLFFWWLTILKRFISAVAHLFL